MPETIQLVDEMPNEILRERKGKFLDEEDFNPDFLFRPKWEYDPKVGPPKRVDTDVDVLKPDGSPLLCLRRGFMPESLLNSVYPIISPAAVETNRRGIAAGGKGWKVESGILGFEAARSYQPARTTAYTKRLMATGDWKQWVVPFAVIANIGFKMFMPERYAAQEAVAEKTNPDFVIPGTVFTTITVNKNYRTAAHTDPGDLREGFGVLTAINKGCRGFWLVFPKYRVAVELNTGDLLLADIGELHGNTYGERISKATVVFDNPGTPLEGVELDLLGDAPGKAGERISCVFYYQTKMQEA